VKLDGKNTPITIGPWSAHRLAAHVTLDDAREWLKKLKAARAAGTLAQVRAELDARLALRGPRVLEAGGDSELVSDLAERFYAVRIEPRRGADAARNLRRVLHNDILPGLGHLPVKTVTPVDCRKVIEGVVARGSKTQAVTVLRALRQFFRWVQGYGIALPLGNPAAPLDPQAVGAAENFPQRWLTDEEIPLFWEALDLERGYFPEIRIVLLTGVRPGELIRAEWEHVDIQRALWKIPPEHRKSYARFKNTATPLGPWYVPLAPAVVELFEELRRSQRGRTSRSVLPSNGSRRGGLPAKGGRIARGRLADAMAEILYKHPLPGGEGGYDRPTPHDLRKTCRTQLDKLGCPFQVGERCLDHSIGSVAQRYLMNDALPERRHFLELWAAKVMTLVAPARTNVTFLGRK
jgi:integrase